MSFTGVLKLKKVSVADIETAIGRVLSELAGTTLHIAVDAIAFPSDGIPPKPGTMSLTVSDPIPDFGAFDKKE